MTQIHVKSYTKSDGTRVKDYWRGGGIMEDDYTPKQDGSVMNIDAPVLEGGISTDVDLGGIDWGSIGGAIAGVAMVAVNVAIKLAPVVLEAYQASQTADPVTLAKITPQIDDSVKALQQIQTQAKTNLDNTFKDLTKAKGQEYSQLYKSYANQKAAYEKTACSTQMIEHAAKNSDYPTVINELQNYQSNYEQVVKQNQAQNPLNTQTQPVNSKPDVSTSFPMHNLNPNATSNDLSAPLMKKGVVDVGMFGVNVKNFGNINDAKEMWKMDKLFKVYRN